VKDVKDILELKLDNKSAAVIFKGMVVGMKGIGK
jgi:hypothetical protein